MDNISLQYSGTGKFYYDGGTGLVYACDGLDGNYDVILRDIYSSQVKVVSPRAIGGTFRTVHDVTKSSISSASSHKYRAVDTSVPVHALVSKEVSADEAAVLPATVAVFTLVGMDEYFIRSLRRHADKTWVAL